MIFFSLFNLINIVQAHEEGAAKVTVANSLGPVLALAIIILAIIAARSIQKRRSVRNQNLNQYDQQGEN